MYYSSFIKNINFLALVKPMRYGTPLVVYTVVRTMQINAAKKD